MTAETVLSPSVLHLIGHNLNQRLRKEMLLLDRCPMDPMDPICILTVPPVCPLCAGVLGGSSLPSPGTILLGLGSDGLFTSRGYNLDISSLESTRRESSGGLEWPSG